MTQLLALPCAIIPMVIFMIIVRRLDRYDPEPLWLLLTHFFWGAVGAYVLSLMVNSKLTALIFGKTAVASGNIKDAAVFIGPPIEECMKALIFILTVRLLDFNNLTDGIVYGATVGFGFAMTENMVYFIQNAGSDNLVQFIMYRTFFSGMLHALACGTFGAALGYTQFNKGKVPILFILGGIIPAIALHMTFNFLVSTESVSTLGFVVIAVTFVGLCLTFAQSLRFEQKFIREELTKEVEEGLIPEEYVELPFKSGQTKAEYKKALICVQIAFERIAAKHVTEDWQIAQAKVILADMHKQLQTIKA